MITRGFDILISGVALLVLMPLFVLIALIVKVDSRGPVIFRQIRVGKDARDFKLLKFRTMKVRKAPDSLLTVGAKDARVTKAGRILRKYKLDELPQLLNVFLGNMSLVGPRPEVRKYVDLYTPEQRKVLLVRPGITDYASIRYMDENDLLEQAEDPEKYYIEHIMPEKIAINLRYLAERSIYKDFLLILKTVKKIIR